ncbi:MAG: SoxR reducing system RseC family protein [Bacteroidales bacterium]|nr:SoxR reducing system RseC family protein [Bacteroidales bacterium]
MKSKKTVSHVAKVVEITPELTTVVFIQHSACSECKAQSLCSVAEDKEKIISIPSDPYNIYEVGEEVEVVMSQTMGTKAVWLCYLMPLLVFMVALFTFSKLPFWHPSELVVGLLSLACIGVYYFILFLLRERLSKEFVFSLNKLPK